MDWTKCRMGRARLRVASRYYGLPDALHRESWRDLTADWHERARRWTLGLQQARPMAATIV
jgi:hypothetical protein